MKSLFPLILITTSFLASSLALAKQDVDSLKLECSELLVIETDTGSTEDIPVGTVIVNFTGKGEIEQILVSRESFQNYKAFKQIFTPKDSKIQHNKQKTGDNPDEGKCSSQLCAEEIEVISAVHSKTGQSVTLRINDHSYAGHPGSSLEYINAGQDLSSSSSGTQVGCDGRVQDPINAGLDAVDFDTELLD